MPKSLFNIWHSFFGMLFWRILHLSSPFLNDVEDTLKMQSTQVQNTTEEQAIVATASQMIHKTLDNIFATPGWLISQMRELRISLVKQ